MTNEQMRKQLRGLNAGRKAERETIADCLCAIAERHGAKIQRKNSDPTPGYCGHGIDLEFFCEGVGAMVSIDDLHGGETALLSWFNADHGGRNFSRRFARGVMDYSPGRMHHKASSLPGDWYSLAMCLDGGLMLAARGDAFAKLDESAAT